MDNRLNPDARVSSWALDRQIWQLGVNLCCTRRELHCALSTLIASVDKSWVFETRPEALVAQFKAIVNDLEAYG